MLADWPWVECLAGRARWFFSSERAPESPPILSAGATMQTQNVYPLHSDGYRDISQFFASHRPPYTLDHIAEFNAIYRRVYPRLGGAERRKAEELVDHLVEHVANPKWASKIYGVV